MQEILIGLLIVAVVALIWFVLNLKKQLEQMTQTKQNDQSLLMVQQQVNSVQQQLQSSLENNAKLINQQLGQVSQMVQQASATVSGQVNSMTLVAGAVQSKLGQLEEASKKIFEVGKDLSNLQEILRAPKLRGGLGEYFLEDILKQIFPPNYYTMQYSFKNGERVDAVIHLADKLVPVDSKFPLESFKRLTEAKSDEETKLARKQFNTAVKTHVDSIAEKYIKPSEKTYEFALMYIPAENVYYETIVKDENFGEEKGLLSYALQSRVIPVSPNSFYAYLQTILMGLKGFEIEKNTTALIQQLAKLQTEIGKFRDDYEKVGKYIGYLYNLYGQSEKRFDKFNDKVEQITQQKTITSTETISVVQITEEITK